MRVSVCVVSSDGADESFNNVDAGESWEVFFCVCVSVWPASVRRMRVLTMWVLW